MVSEIIYLIVYNCNRFQDNTSAPILSPPSTETNSFAQYFTDWSQQTPPMLVWLQQIYRLKLTNFIHSFTAHLLTHIHSWEAPQFSP